MSQRILTPKHILGWYKKNIIGKRLKTKLRHLSHMEIITILHLQLSWIITSHLKTVSITHQGVHTVMDTGTLLISAISKGKKGVRLSSSSTEESVDMRQKNWRGREKEIMEEMGGRNIQNKNKLRWSYSMILEKSRAMSGCLRKIILMAIIPSILSLKVTASVLLRCLVMMREMIFCSTLMTG